MMRDDVRRLAAAVEALTAELRAGRQCGPSQPRVDDSRLVALLAGWAETRGEWWGTSGDLLAELRAHAAGSDVALPASPRGLSGRLRRYAPAMRALGVGIRMNTREGGTGRRLIWVGWLPLC